MEPNQQNKASKQNITRDIEIKNNLTVTRGGRGIAGKKGEGSSQGTCIKDPGQSQRRVGLRVGGGGGWGGGSGDRKMETTLLEQLYLNDSLKKNL